MDQLSEFIGNNLLLSGLFAVVLAAWLTWEVARLGRKWKELDVMAAVMLINREDPLILDVSNSTDYAKGHLAGALHMPPSRIEAGNTNLLKHKEMPVLVYCQTGQVSQQMATRLVKLGFTQVHMLSGGLAQWRSENQPVTKDKSPARKKPKRDKAAPASEAEQSTDAEQAQAKD